MMTCFAAALYSWILWNLPSASCADDCVQGDLVRVARKFPSISHIKTINATITPESEAQYFFPSLNTDCDVYITKWMYKGDLKQNELQQYPALQLWKKEILSLFFVLEKSTDYYSVKQPITQSEDGMVEFELETPLKFDDDNFIGMYIPSNPTPIFFEMDTTHHGQQYLYMEADRQQSLVLSFDDIETGHQMIPLITVELSLTSVQPPEVFVKDILPTRTTAMSTSLNINATANTQVITTTAGTITDTRGLPTSLSPPSAITTSINHEFEILDENINSKKPQQNYKIEAHALLIGIGSIGMLTLFLIVFTVVTCIVFSIMKKKIRTIQKMESITNTYNSRDSLVTNHAYSRANHDRPYDKLMRASTSVTNIDHIQRLKSSAISMSNIRFSQSLPLPDIPQSLPLPPHSHPIPRSTTMPQISSHYTHVYDLPNEVIPREYEQPIGPSWLSNT